jgi:endoglucanase
MMKIRAIEHVLPFGRRETLLGGFALAGLANTAAAGPAGDPWAQYKARFLERDGRIVDTENGRVSHSEGQAWAMLLAVRHDDRASFDLILNWTRRNLGIRGDRLLAWRYNPAISTPVLDLNCATDGDLCYAWALLDAARRWQAPAYRELAQGVAADILRFAARQLEGRVILLPGAWGFDQGEHIVVNPSYYVFPALEALAEAFPRPEWRALLQEGDRLTNEAQFGRWKLPTDWVVLSRRGGGFQPEPRRGLRFGPDAVRVPLFLAWSGRWEAPALRHAARFWADPNHPYMPAWVEVMQDRISPFAASLGTIAIERLVARQGAIPSHPGPGDGYYDSSLALLAAAARREAPAPERPRA